MEVLEDKVLNEVALFHRVQHIGAVDHGLLLAIHPHPLDAVLFS